jgi:hypothetical protein
MGGTLLVGQLGCFKRTSSSSADGQSQVQLPDPVMERQLNWSWAGFFARHGRALNLWVAYEL